MTGTNWRPPEPDAIGQSLAAYLRERTGAGALALQTGPAPVALGVETWIYGFTLKSAPAPLSGELVLRLFPPDADPMQARFEGVVQNTLATQGLPVPRALWICEDSTVLGGPFLVMERVPGRMMLDSLFGGGHVVLEAPRLVREALTTLPRTVAREQLQLHRIDPSPLQKALAQASVPDVLYTVDGWLAGIRSQMTALDADELKTGVEWLEEHKPPEPERPVVCHCDFLPPNLFVENGRVTGIIDWSHTTLAAPEWDVANTRLRLAMNPFEVPRALSWLIGPVRKRATRAYYEAYESAQPLDHGRVDYYEVLVGMWLLLHVAEARRYGGNDGRDGRGANPWLPRGATAPLVEHCRRVTGTSLGLGSAITHRDPQGE